MQIFEAIMLFCFGISWPISIMKSLREKKVAGKSPLFMIIIAFGYLSGIVYKLTGIIDWVLLLYILNLFFVLIDLLIYFYLIKNFTKD